MTQIHYLNEDYSNHYWSSTKETLVGLYAKRHPETGEPVENINEIINRVASSIALAELKYILSAEELININLEQALSHPEVIHWAKTFADHIGNQKFWANTPANINADPEVSLKVLKYWAYGISANLSEEEIWLKSEDLRHAYINNTMDDFFDYEKKMAALASELYGKGCLAACGVAYVEDSLESIQETARIEALAAKAAMGMGLNTSTLRPWSTIISNGAAASGPDRFYEKSIAKAVEAVAQGGRRGGALIELRNSDHPDILFFIDKKRLTPPPSLAHIYEEVQQHNQKLPGEPSSGYQTRLLALAEKKFGHLHALYLERQNYLKNTNITVLAMPGFMEAVKEKLFYPAIFAGKAWAGPLYDPRSPIIDPDTALPQINKLTKESIFAEYTVNLDSFPEALQAAHRLSDSTTVEINETHIKVKGHFYAPDIFMRIIQGMQDSGEPGIAFYDTVNAGNANDHAYVLHTCNPCGEQFLPAGRGLDGRLYMGNCNLSSLHAAHTDFWHEDGSYNMQAMKNAVTIQQRFMDNVTDVSWYPIPSQNMTARLERRNGGGFAGIAEYLSRLGVEFGNRDGLKATEELFRAYIDAAFKSSCELAEERGVYPLWQGSRYQRQGIKIRNTCTTNNAPTGTLAQALQTSWGIDPHNGIVFSRQVRSRKVDFVAPGFAEMMKKHGAWPTKAEEQIKLMAKIRQNNKSCRNLSEIPAAIQHAFPIRIEVEPQAYVRHLAAIHNAASDHPETFNSVSNTCSIPINYHLHSIYEATILAWKLKVKDITFYPDGSRISQPIEKIATANYQYQIENDENKSRLLLCSICGSHDWLKIDGCLVCQGCGYSKCN